MSAAHKLRVHKLRDHKLRDRGTGMSMTVKTVTRWLKGPILLFGIYLVLYGHITPGGGFGGGVVIASAFILIMLATGERVGLSIFSKAAASRLDSVGLLIFLILGWLGTWWAGGYFFWKFHPYLRSRAVHRSQWRNHTPGECRPGAQGRQCAVPCIHGIDSVPDRGAGGRNP